MAYGWGVYEDSRHSPMTPNFRDKTIWIGDNLALLRGMGKWR